MHKYMEKEQNIVNKTECEYHQMTNTLKKEKKRKNTSFYIQKKR